MAKKKPILNPKRPSTKAPVLSVEEEAFISGNNETVNTSEEKKPVAKKEKNRGYPISMPPSFYEAVKAFAEAHPEQGTVSSIFVRGAATLMKGVESNN